MRGGLAARAARLAAAALLAAGVAAAARAHDPLAPARDWAPYKGTGRVPLEGAVALSHDDPEPGDTLFVYFSATPLVTLEGVVLSLQLPEGVEPLEGARLEKELWRIEAGETARLDVGVRVREAGELRFVGRARWSPGAGRTLGRSFVAILHPEPPAGRAPRDATSADGEPLVVYPGHAPAEPPAADPSTPR